MERCIGSPLRCTFSCITAANLKTNTGLLDPSCLSLRLRVHGVATFLHEGLAILSVERRVVRRRASPDSELGRKRETGRDVLTPQGKVTKMAQDTPKRKVKKHQQMIQ